MASLKWLAQLFGLILVIGYSASQSDEIPILSPYILGGHQTIIEIHPYIANYGGICGGSIISEKWILTAAHCEDKAKTVSLGSDYKHHGKRFEIKRHVIHENFGGITGPRQFDYDYQLLELVEPLEFNEFIQPIELGDESDIVEGELATVTGWGALRESGLASENLMTVDVPIVSLDVCKKVVDVILTPRMICSGYKEGGKDACQGDSGGPMVAHGRLIGIVSFGIGCGRPGLPGIYSKVPAARDWIKNITGI